MSECKQELCRNWIGMGCICQTMDIEPDVVASVDGDDSDWYDWLPADPEAADS